MQDDFLSRYLDYTRDTEAPAIYHRWSILTALAAYIGRTYYVKHGHNNIYPNLYVILLGGAGTRKNSAINLAKKIIRQSGYKTIAASKTTKEKFFLDLADVHKASGGYDPTDDILEQNLFGPQSTPDPSICHEMFIASGEFNTFFGNNILDFLTDLGELWDYEGIFESKIKNGVSVSIPNPNISILGGNTPTLFASTFPPEFIGQGFFSRTLLIYGERTRPKITFPEEPESKLTEELVAEIKTFRGLIQTRMEFTSDAKKLLEAIYHAPESISDPRFESFYNRRLTILFKLSLILAVIDHSSNIRFKDVLYANTILSHAEHLMPKALGEFGRAKNSDVTHKVLQVIYNSIGICSAKEIWQHVHSDLEKFSDLSPILENLRIADKIQVAPEGKGFLPKRKLLTEESNGMIDFSLLTLEERNMHK
jgi:Protein of unknown function (DUF3987)